MANNNRNGYEETVLQEIVKPRSGFWGRWLNLTAPPRNEDTTAGPLKREELRKGELIGYFLFVLFLFMIFDIYVALRNPLTSLPLVIVFILILLGVAFLNRKGHTIIAGTIMSAGMIFAIMGVIFFVFGRRNSPADLFASYDFFVYPILIASLFLPRNLIWPFTGLSIAFVITHVLFAPHPNAVREVLLQDGVITPIIRPVSIIFMVALISWIVLGNLQRSLLQVDRAEELVAARQIVAVQSQQLAEQNERLDAGIRQLLGVHQEAARGNYAVRATIHSEDIVWQVGRSLNNLLIRYEQLAHDSQEMQQTRQEVEQVARSLEEVSQGRRTMFPQVATPIGKRILFALRRFQPRNNSTQLRSFAEQSPNPNDPLQRSSPGIPLQNTSANYPLQQPAQRPPTTPPPPRPSQSSPSWSGQVDSARFQPGKQPKWSEISE